MSINVNKKTPFMIAFFNIYKKVFIMKIRNKFDEGMNDAVDASTERVSEVLLIISIKAVQLKITTKCDELYGVI
jgi:hypothetical protein